MSQRFQQGFQSLVRRPALQALDNQQQRESVNIRQKFRFEVREYMDLESFFNGFYFKVLNIRINPSNVNIKYIH